MLHRVMQIRAVQPHRFCWALRVCRRCNWALGVVTFLMLSVVQWAALGAEPVRPCRVEVVEAGSGWPVPLVELRTTHQMRWVTDNAGVAALDAPELMNREVWLEVRSPGYGLDPDGFGMRGVRVRPVPGGGVRIEVRRFSIARRLGRITGAGLFAESQKLGGFAEESESGVWGCDSVQIAAHGGRLHWVWGTPPCRVTPWGFFMRPVPLPRLSRYRGPCLRCEFRFVCLRTMLVVPGRWPRCQATVPRG